MRDIAIFLLLVLALAEGYKIHNQNEELGDLRSSLNAAQATKTTARNWLDDRIDGRGHPLDASAYHQNQAVNGPIPPTDVWIDQKGQVHN
ncbi:MAG: hypothetical protein QM796_05405 [Chthoniobacteraceae bacterium]